ncbi:acyl-CoA dehydrogenase [Bordetella petrii]|nr:acyl-CoA dehydrogenase [Bordetella petrii]
MSTPFFPHLDRESEIRRAVQSLCSKFPLDYWDKHDLEHEFPEEFYQDFAKSGFLSILVPTEYGGSGGTISEMAAALEEVAAGGGGQNACASVHIPLLAVPAISTFGTEEQKQKYLPQIAEGKLFVTFGVTEPDAGTDTTKIKTAGVLKDGRYIVNGSKVWNSGALRGDKILLLARTSTPAPGERRGNGLTLFLTDLRADTVEVRAIPKIGRNAVPSCEVFFSDHPIPESDIIGEVGQGFYHILHSLNAERLFLASEALGIGRWALLNARQYAQDRVVFGRQIGKNQAVQHPLAKSYVQILAASEVVCAALDAYAEQGASAIGTLANAAKYLATEAEFQATDTAMQVFGGYSYAREYHVGRHWIEARLQRVAPVNNDMVLNYLAERELDLPRSY